MRGNLTIECIKQAVAQVALQYGLKRVILFGSFASGRQTKQSDIDLLVEFSPTELVTLFTLIGLQQELESLTGRKVDVIETPIEPGSIIEIDQEVVVYE